MRLAVHYGSVERQLHRCIHGFYPYSGSILQGKGTKNKLPPTEPGGKPVYKWRLERNK